MNMREHAETQILRLREHLLSEIQNEGFPLGGKLPTERQLCEQFHLARHSVRKVLEQLEAEGKIIRHVGRGTFAAEGYGVLERYKDLALDVASPDQVMEVRLLLEPRIASLAAVRGVTQDLRQIQMTIVQGQKSTHWAEFEKWDDAFHQTIVASTKNEFLGRLYEAISKVRHEAPWGRLKKRSLTDERMRAYLAEHQEIADALEKRDADAAAAAMTRHLRRVQNNLLGREPLDD